MIVKYSFLWERNLGKKMNKKGLEMTFNWIFAVIAGIAVLFIAIYATTQLIDTSRTELDAQTTARLAIILDPLETSLESGKSSLISFASEARIYNDKCYTYGNFGSQQIGISVSSGLGGKWKTPTYGKNIYNKYLFSQDIEEAKDFSILTMPFNMPFKVSDLIIFSGTEYCFLQAPNEIKDGLEDLNLKDVQFVNQKSNCSENSETVCFSTSGCDINVHGKTENDFSSGYVSKEGKSMYYTDNMLYAAIFSSPEVYECNVKRLMLRLVNLCLIYKDEIKILEKKGCSSLLESSLGELIALADRASSSKGLLAVQEKAKEVEDINEAAVCKLW